MSKKLVLRSMNSWRNLRYSAFTITIFVIGATFVCDAWAKDEVTFHFNPPDGTRFVETMRYTKTITAEGLIEPTVETTESKLKYVISKTDFGCSVVITPIEPSIKASEDMSGMLSSMLSNMVLTFDLDPQGRLLRVGGTEKITEMMKQILPKDMMELFVAIFEQSGKSFEEIAKQSAIDNWNNRAMLGMFVGQTFVLNKTYSGTLKLPIPTGGSILASRKLKISGQRPYKGHQCISVHVSNESKDPEIGEKIGEIMKSLFAGVLTKIEPTKADELAKLIPDFQMSNPKVTNQTTRLVDPTTGLIYLEIQTNIMQAIIVIDGEEKSKFTHRDKKEYFYTYEQ